MGKRHNEWHTGNEALALFGDNLSLARRRYRKYLKQRDGKDTRPDLIGGGLVRSAGGWDALRAMRKAGVFLKSDERILGSSQFVESVLSDAQEAMHRQTALASSGVDFDQLVSVVCDRFAVERQELVGPCKERRIVKDRILVCFWAVRVLGFSMTEVAAKLAISVPIVSVAIQDA